MLRHYGLTPSAFAALPDSDQSFMLGYELYRARNLNDWREALVGDDPKKSNYTPEAATLIRLEAL